MIKNQLFRLLLLLLPLLLSLTTSCQIQTLAPEPKKATVQCTSSENCPSGLSCELDLRICVNTERNELQVDLQLIPPPDKSLVRNQWVGVDLNRDENEPKALLLRMNGQVVVKGVVRLEDDPGGVQAKIVATAKGDIKNTIFRYEAQTTDNNDGSDNYTMTLKAGLTYDISVTLLGADQPTYRVQKTFTAEDRRFSLVFPSPKNYWKISGKLFWANGEPAQGIQIQAYQLDGSRSSTLAITESDGSFEVRIWPEAAKYVLRASPSSDSLQIPVLDLKQIDAVANQNLVGVIDFPKLPKVVDFTLTVTALDENGQAKKLSNVSVTLSSQLLGGSFSRTALTGSSGTVSLSLFEGSYQVAVVPQLSGPLALKQQTIRVGEGETESVSMLLSPKTTVEGRILRPGSSSGADQATVIFTLTQSTQSTFPVVEGRRFTAITDSNGIYSLALDPGFYNVLIVPSIESGLPRKLFKSVAVDRNGELTELTLDTPSVLSGRVVDINDLPISGVTVEVYDHSNPTPINISYGVTDEDGNFKLLVPFIKP